MYLPGLVHAYRRDIQVFQAAKGMVDSHEALLDLLESSEHFLNRLDIYTKIPPTPAVDEVIVKIMVELISTLALATKELKQGRLSKYFVVDMLSYSVHHREIRKKDVLWRNGCRGSPTEAGSPHPGRGSNDRSGDTQSRLRSCPGYESANAFYLSLAGC